MQVRGHVKLELMRELAMQSAPHDVVAARFDLKTSEVKSFEDRNYDAIQEIRLALLEEVVNETAGLWISHKAKRIAEYQEDVDLINIRLANLEDEDELEPATLTAIRTKHNALKSVAEELAQLPTRSTTPQVDENVFHYSIVGTTTEGLRGDLS